VGDLPVVLVFESINEHEKLIINEKRNINQTHHKKKTKKRQKKKKKKKMKRWVEIDVLLFQRQKRKKILKKTHLPEQFFGIMAS
jgi:hypothetical protein